MVRPPHYTIHRVSKVFGVLEDNSKRVCPLILPVNFEKKKQSQEKLNNHPIIDELSKISLDNLTPKKALDILYKWKEKWCENKISD
jgi:DNA mismatch repair ATPase MutS